MNPYIQDILSQPATLRKALENYSTSALQNISLEDYDRIILREWVPPIMRRILH